MIGIILIIFSFSVKWSTFYNSEMINDWAEFADTLYLATNGGILQGVFNDSLIVTRRFTNLEGVTDPIINSIAVQEDGSIWAVSDHHLFVKSHNSSTFVIYPYLNFEHDSLTSVDIFGDCIFISSLSGITVISNHGTPTNFDDDVISSYNSMNLPIESDSILKLRIMRDTLYFGTPEEFCYSSLPGFPDSLHRIPSDSLPGAIGQRKSIKDFYKGPGVLALLTNNAIFVKNIDGNWLILNHVDFEGNTLWFCGYHIISGFSNTIFAGLGCLVNGNNTPVEKLPLISIDSFGNASLLSPDEVSCSPSPHITQIIPISRDTLLIGTVCNHVENLSFSERKCGGFTWIKKGRYWNHEKLGILPNNYISGIKKTPDGKIWLFTSLIYVPNYSSRLFYFDGANFHPAGDFYHIFHDSTGELDLITDMEVDNSGKLWISTNHNGIYRINGDTADLHLYPSEFIKSIGFTYDNRLVYTTNSGTFIHSESQDIKISSLTRVYSITHDDNGNLWLGDITNGFEVYSPNNQLIMSSSNYPNLPSTSIRSIAHFGNIHFSGTDNGIVVFNGRMVDRELLPGVVIRSLAIDTYGYLWVLSQDGIYVIDTREYSLKYYFSSINSGLAGDTRDVGPNFFYYKLIRDDILVDESTHSMWIGTTHGLSVIKTDLYWNYSRRGVKPIVFPSPVRPGQKFVTVSGLNDNDKVFLYKMDGTKIDMKFERGRGFVRFSAEDLSPGSYIILVGGKKLLFSVIK